MNCRAVFECAKSMSNVSIMTFVALTVNQFKFFLTVRVPNEQKDSLDYHVSPISFG